MTEKLIHCPACHSENLANSVYCCQCGYALRKGIISRVRKRQWIPIVVMTLILSFIMTSIIQFYTSRQAGQPPGGKQQHVQQGDDADRQHEMETIAAPGEGKKSSFAGRLMPEEMQAQESESVIVGTVSIVNPEGFTVTSFPAAVTGGSWLALPARACIGGNKWLFKVGNDAPIPIEGGLWGRGDAVGFWRLGGEKQFQGPGFATWQQEKPVHHFSLKTGLPSEPMLLNPSGVEGAFILSSLPGLLDAGVFMQNNKVVGWSFGDVLDDAYMWPLGPGAALLYENYVDDFYNETFAGGREEYLSLAITKGKDSSPQSQLQMFSEAFRLQPKLLPAETPRYLRTESLYPFILKLVSHIMNQEAYHYIATLAEEPMLWEIRAPDLMMNVIRATRNVYGVETAVNFIEGAGEGILQTMEGKNEILRLHLELYLGWIKNLLDNGNIAQGWQVYNRAQPHFAESPELHMLAVELALAEGNWVEGERLLYQREYPASVRETRMLLADRISDLKGQENKIVLRFAVGSREIPVTANVNDGLDHRFLVDTGASFVTIPYATVQALGLEDEMSLHQMEVQTAGGPVKANAVTLSSIELQGWAVSNVKALVMDLPNRPGLGLLGLNFLNNFRLDLQADEGILILEPK